MPFLSAVVAGRRIAECVPRLQRTFVAVGGGGAALAGRAALRRRGATAVNAGLVAVLEAVVMRGSAALLLGGVALQVVAVGVALAAPPVGHFGALLPPQSTPGLVAVLDAVGGGRCLANVGLADGALAIVLRCAALAVRAGGGLGAAAVNVGLVVVLDAVGRGRLVADLVTADVGRAVRRTLADPPAAQGVVSRPQVGIRRGIGSSVQRLAGSLFLGCRTRECQRKGNAQGEPAK